MSHVLTIRCGGCEYSFSIDHSTSFSHVKGLLLDELRKLDIVQTSTSSSFYVIKIEYVSLLHDIKVVVIPHEQSSVFSTLERLQRHGLCSVYVHMVDIRRKSSHRYLSNQRSTNILDVSNSINYLPKVGSHDSLSKLMYSRYPISCNVADYIFWTLSSMASIQGKLMRKVENGKKQTLWRCVLIFHFFFFYLG